MALDIIAIMTTAPGKDAEAEKVLNDLCADVKNKEPNTERYKPYKVVSGEGEEGSKYALIERYLDEDSLEVHRASEHYKAAMKKGTDDGLLAGMTIYMLEPLSDGFDSR